MKNLCVLDMNRYKQLCDEPTNPDDSIHFEQIQEIYKYNTIIFKKLVFINRKQLFTIINKFLDQKIHIFEFFKQFYTFENTLSKAEQKFISELKQFKNLELLTICKCELKLDLGSDEFQTLYEFIQLKALEKEDGIIFTEEKIQEFYKALQKLFEKVQKLEEFSS